MGRHRPNGDAELKPAESLMGGAEHSVVGLNLEPGFRVVVAGGCGGIGRLLVTSLLAQQCRVAVMYGFVGQVVIDLHRGTHPHRLRH